MTTPAKLAANRENALASTGPRTQEGKARVAQNAVTHGLLARNAVLPTEDSEAFAAFHHRFVETLAPEGELETLLVDRVVSQAWRFGRLGLHRRGGGRRGGSAPAQRRYCPLLRARIGSGCGWRCWRSQPAARELHAAQPLLHASKEWADQQPLEQASGGPTPRTTGCCLRAAAVE